MRVGLIQLNGTDDPASNLATLQSLIAEAARQGAEFVLTPEVSNCISTSRAHQEAVLTCEEKDLFLAGLSATAAEHAIWLLAGSLALKTNDPDGRFANRSFLIDPEGRITARYDKIHMFDVAVSEQETYRESKGYRPGEAAVLAKTPFGIVGLTICYDLRFPYLYRDLAKAGAVILTAPSAFSQVTGRAHWETLLRARAIETGCFLLAPAQTGQHNGRATYGHSMIVAPWGEVLLDMGEGPGAAVVDIDLGEVDKARQRVPSLSHDRPYQKPV